MKIFVIGGSGFVGARILKNIKDIYCLHGSYYSNETIYPIEKPLIKLDVGNKKSVFREIKKINPDIVILICGSRNIEHCDAFPEEASYDHYTGTLNVIEACKEIMARLVYISTDCVFNGDHIFNCEIDTPIPYNVYGKEKLKAEIEIQKSKIDCAIVRLSLTYGWPEKEQNGNFVSNLISHLISNKNFKAATNLFNTPIEVNEAANAIIQIATGKYQGIFHVAGMERISRYKFAKLAADIFGLKSELVLPFKDTCRLRPINSCLSTDITQKKIRFKFHDVKMGLIALEKELYNKGIL